MKQGRDGAKAPSLSFARALAHLSLFVGLLATVPGSAAAQTYERPWLDWRTLETPHFTLHFPSAFEPWARYVGARMDAVDSAVARIVGFTPPARVHIVIEDPYTIANGFALPFIDRPVIVFWATPPDPREDIGSFRVWGEMLAVHEFAHVAHLSRPSRNPFTRTLWRLLPANLGPIPVRAPRWVVEGYATYVEGRVTGSGRPHGVWRAAMLRQWAIEGRLPTYGQLSSWGDFAGGDFAYLAGSAYLEWLVERQGDSSLAHVWRRLTARRNRTFADAFAGIYGQSPQDLYGRFTAELTGRALEVDRRIDAAGRVEGELVQRLSWSTGDPTISPDGKRVAIVLRSNSRPARVVVWSTEAEPDTADVRARERLLRRDPEDVPARRFYPVSKRAQATLLAKGGRGYDDPRWLSDGERVLLSRLTPRPDGSFRPELYLWNTRRARVRRLTNGAGARDADPFPNGRSAAAIRCVAGRCDLIIVDLASGDTRTLLAGDVSTSYARPRVAPDGRTIAVAVHRGDDARWRIALIDSAGGTPRFVDPDDGASRYDPAWLSKTTLVAASERGGIVNLERLDLDASGGVANARALTRVTGAAVAPEPNPADSSIWFLSLHSHGFDVRRLSPNALSRIGTEPLDSARLDSRLVPAVVEPQRSVGTFAPSAQPLSRRYDAGSRTTRWFPLGTASVDGRAGGLALSNIDVVGRLSVLARGLIGVDGAWRGAALDAAWRSTRPQFGASLFLARQTPTWSGQALLPPNLYDVELRGGTARLDYSHSFDMAQLSAAVGGSLARMEILDRPAPADGQRQLAFAELGGAARQTGDGPSVTESVWFHGSAGRSGAPTSDFVRIVVTGGLRTAGRGILPLDLSASYGRVSDDSNPYEYFLIGGSPSALIDRSVLSQRVTVPAVPIGVAVGRRAAWYRAAIPFGVFTPYYWGASATLLGERFTEWHRVAGVELSFDMASVPVAGTPGGHFVAGVARSLDAPFARRTEGYVSVVLRP